MSPWVQRHHRTCGTSTWTPRGWTVEPSPSRGRIGSRRPRYLVPWTGTGDRRTPPPRSRNDPDPIIAPTQLRRLSRGTERPRGGHRALESPIGLEGEQASCWIGARLPATGPVVRRQPPRQTEEGHGRDVAGRTTVVGVVYRRRR